MFLTKIVLNPARKGTHQLVSNPRSLHAAIQKAFPDNGDRILWWLDTSARDPQVFILSPTTPSVEHIIEQAGRANDSTGLVTKDYSPVLQSVSEGAVYRMQVDANITKSVQGKRVPLFREEDIEQWFNRQGENHGFKLVSTLSVIPKIPVIVRKDGYKVTLEHHLLDCKINVTDGEKFKQLIKSGLGRGKAYGLGMITLGKP